MNYITFTGIAVTPDRGITATFTAPPSENITTSPTHPRAVYHHFFQIHQEVLLFGPTDAKTELFNMLKTDRHFEKVKVETKDADKMTQNEQHAFVRDHFSKKI